MIKLYFKATQVDEIIAISNIYETKKEIHSYEILKHVVDELFE